jgi:hypothetical protein
MHARSAQAPAVLSSSIELTIVYQNPTPQPGSSLQERCRVEGHNHQHVVSNVGASARRWQPARASSEALTASPRLAYRAKPIKPRHIPCPPHY